MKSWLKPFKKLRACQEAIDWAEQYDSLDKAWLKCEQGDWMLWLVGKLSGDPASVARRTLTLAACECARLALPYAKEGENRSLVAIETAEQWAGGKNGVTLDDVRNAAHAASSTPSALRVHGRVTT